MKIQIIESTNGIKSVPLNMECAQPMGTETNDAVSPMMCSFLTPQVLVAAFAVSGYCSTYFRAGSKPFNPVLGETYECIREDKGFRFFSEQVSEVAVQGKRAAW